MNSDADPATIKNHGEIATPTATPPAIVRNTNPTAVRNSDNLSPNTPAAPGAAITRTFFTHCFGRASLTYASAPPIGACSGSGSGTAGLLISPAVRARRPRRGLRDGPCPGA